MCYGCRNHTRATRPRPRRRPKAWPARGRSRQESKGGRSHEQRRAERVLEDNRNNWRKRGGDRENRHRLREDRAAGRSRRRQHPQKTRRSNKSGLKRGGRAGSWRAGSCGRRTGNSGRRTGSCGRQAGSSGRRAGTQWPAGMEQRLAGMDAATGGHGAATGGHGAATGGHGAATGGHGAATGVKIEKKSRPTKAGRERSAPMSGYYLVTLSSHLTIESMTSIDRPHAATNTNHVAHIGTLV